MEWDSHKDSTRANAYGPNLLGSCIIDEISIKIDDLEAKTVIQAYVWN